MSEFRFPASRVQNGNNVSITAYNAEAKNPIFFADQSHPNFEAIEHGLRVGDPNVWDLFDIAGGIMRQFKQVTDRIGWNGSEILFDGDPVHSVLSEQLERAIRDGDPANYTALAKFWEKLESNPNQHSREQAYEFLSTHAFQITADGDVVGYKGMRDNGDGTYSSTAASRVADKPSAFVNGAPAKPLSVVTQKVGDVVSMPRSEVTHDPTRSCERGLHVATRSYAATYGTVMQVTFNPRDIVSVPTADRGEKVRVCKYKNERPAPTDDDARPVLKSFDEPVWAGDVGYRVD